MRANVQSHAPAAVSSMHGMGNPSRTVKVASELGCCGILQIAQQRVFNSISMWWEELQGKSKAAAVSLSSEFTTSAWLIVGLGNPGPKYAGTRHNIGFDIVDALATAESITLEPSEHKAFLGAGHLAGVPVLLAKPQTYMNRSGESVSKLTKAFKVPLERLLVVYDDLDIEAGAMRLRAKGGHGGHNGLRSIMAHHENVKQIARLRVGIGRPPPGVAVPKHVLTQFTSKELSIMRDTKTESVDVIRTVLVSGIDKAVSKKGLYKPQVNAATSSTEHGEELAAAKRSVDPATGEQNVLPAAGEQGVEPAAGEQGVLPAAGEQGVEPAAGEQGVELAVRE
ncbi:hypothetical protein CYMTET_51834 [Cymbomonas tetramitiformis]|uniref:peptidyl-tRNA hydrolase n=1 Tax=Cymbomonas tetramitiformis TaxID=36881 RepID=A0AAE0ERY4_9CHLO|nr:hypothetical protein CYMTET_51834 [Cymbomonas tetramitiformis]